MEFLVLPVILLLCLFLQTVSATLLFYNFTTPTLELVLLAQTYMDQIVLLVVAESMYPFVLPVLWVTTCLTLRLVVSVPRRAQPVPLKLTAPHVCQPSLISMARVSATQLLNIS